MSGWPPGRPPRPSATLEYYRGTLTGLYLAWLRAPNQLTMRRLFPCVSVLVCTLAWPDAAGAQAIETVGERAMGMGGAFVAVADDSSATWWNPAAPAAGPFLDLAAGWSRSSSGSVSRSAR